MGGYPAGAQYDSRAPWNETSAPCPRCGGTGRIYYEYDPVLSESVEVSRERYLSLPAADDVDEDVNCRDCEARCLSCGGDGRLYYDGNGRRK